MEEAVENYFPPFLSELLLVFVQFIDEVRIFSSKANEKSSNQEL